MSSRNIFRGFFCANVFMFVLLTSNHTVFLIQLEINCTCVCEFFKKLKLHSLKRLVQLQHFEKLICAKLIKNWTLNRMIIYTISNCDKTVCDLGIKCTNQSSSSCTNITKGLVIYLRAQVLQTKDLVPFTEIGKVHTCTVYL